MKAFLTILAVLFTFPASADESAAADGATHRYVIERTFPAGALDGLDAATKEKVNENNATVGVRWLHSYTPTPRRPRRSVSTRARARMRCGRPLH